MHFSVTYIPKFQKKIGVYHGATSRNHWTRANSKETKSLGGGGGGLAVDKSASIKACYQLILQNFRQGNLNDFYFQNVCHLDLQLFHLL